MRIALLVLGLLHDTLILLLELEDLLLLRCDGLAQLLDKVVHVLDLLIYLGDNLGLALLKEDASKFFYFLFFNHCRLLFKASIRVTYSCNKFIAVTSKFELF